MGCEFGDSISIYPRDVSSSRVMPKDRISPTSPLTVRFSPPFWNDPLTDAYLCGCVCVRRERGTLHMTNSTRSFLPAFLPSWHLWPWATLGIIIFIPSRMSVCHPLCLSNRLSDSLTIHFLTPLPEDFFRMFSGTLIIFRLSVSLYARLEGALLFQTGIIQEYFRTHHTFRCFSFQCNPCKKCPI